MIQIRQSCELRLINGSAPLPKAEIRAEYELPSQNQNWEIFGYEQRRNDSNLITPTRA